MSTKQHYDEDFKRTLVELYHNGKTQASLIKEYGVSQTALPDGSNSIQLLKLMTVKFLLQSR